MLPVIAGQWQLQVLALFQAGNHIKQVFGAGVALGNERAQQAIRDFLHVLGKG